MSRITFEFGRALVVGAIALSAAGQSAPAEAADTAVPQSRADEPSATRTSEIQSESAPPPRATLGVPDPAPRRRAIYCVLGVATPIGFVGFEGVFRLGALFEVAGGFGVGGSATQAETNASVGHALQWTLMPRLRLGDDHHAFTAGAGISGGEYGGFDLFGVGPGCHSDNDPCSGGFQTRYSLWANLEIGGEHWGRSGFALRYFLGLARGMTLDPVGSSVNGQTLLLPYFGLGLGYAF